MVAFADALVQRQESRGVPTSIGPSPWLASQVNPKKVPPQYAAIMVGRDKVDDLVENGIALMSWANGLAFDTDAIADPAYVENLVVPTEPATRISVIYRWFPTAKAARAGAEAARDFLHTDLEEMTPDSWLFTTAHQYLPGAEPLCPGDLCLASWHPPTLTYLVQTGELCAMIVSTQADNRLALSRTLGLSNAIVANVRGVAPEQE
jgi:hypothetical protein